MPVASRLAVVITSYNYERYVGEAIESVLSQDRNDVEVVVVDDGSTDSSWRVVQSYHGIQAVRVKNGGPVAACVQGLNMTTAPFILFLDSDDRLEPGSLDVILRRLDPQIAKLQFSLKRIDGDGQQVLPAFRKLNDFRSRNRLMEEVRMNGSYFTPPTSGNVFRRDVADLLREIDYADASADGVTAYAAPFYGDVLSLSDELASYRVHGRNATAFGRVTPDVFDWETRRFLDTMGHLKRVLERLGQDTGFPAATSLYTYQDREFCRTIATGVRPSARKLLTVLRSLRRQRMSKRNKTGLVLFFVLASISRPRRAQRLLAYRYRTLGRTATGFLRVALSPLEKTTN